MAGVKQGGDFGAFERVMGQAVRRSSGRGGRLRTRCLVGIHRCLVLKVPADSVLGLFMEWLTTTYAEWCRVMSVG